ncbi:transposase [Bradyrhizobium sp. 186]|uniref:transposase n=1 Tax=Bradyrhizobium sp. 186 TaxID=2782654 RepID=UPI002000B769|nr:transposase [Bradyrhizobium sp. 186]UPK38548.1 transposase [Bradyrhizobium sp. 186]
MSKTFRPWDVDQVWLLPPSVQDLVPPGHVAHFVRDTVRTGLDLSAIMDAYDEERGFPPYHPGMMVALLLYAYSQGIYSSRRIARGCEERLDFAAVTGMQRPDFRTISEFRKAALEAEAKAAAETKAASKPDDDGSGDGGRGRPGRKSKPVTAEPSDKAQRNFTDPDSRVMPTKNGFIQGYNAQAAVDGAHQIIVAHTLTNSPSDQAQLAPLLDAIKANLGTNPDEASADAGYCSQANLRTLVRRRIEGYVATGRQKHGTKAATAKRKLKSGTLIARMSTKLKRAGYRSRYRLRKQIVEPVFGQIKQARGFRQFLLRGIDKVKAEWAMICTAHNLTKLAAAR